MNLSFCISIDDCRQAQDILRNRIAEARKRLRVLEEGHGDRILGFASGTVSSEQLDAVLFEKSRLELIASEDHGEVLEALNRRAEEIRQEEIFEVRRAEVLREKQAWATLFNSYLSGTTGLNERQRTELLRTRSNEFPAWILERFIALAADYVTLPVGKTLGQFCKMSPYEPGIEYFWDPKSIN